MMAMVLIIGSGEWVHGKEELPYLRLIKLLSTKQVFDTFKIPLFYISLQFFFFNERRDSGRREGSSGGDGGDGRGQVFIGVTSAPEGFLYYPHSATLWSRP